MELDELSEAWNTLRNDAIGRGVAPIVGPALAREFNTQYSAWRKALIHLPAAADMMASVYTRGWVAKYRKMRAKVSASGVKATSDLARTPMELSLEALDKLAQNVAIGAGVGGVLLVAFMWATRRRGNGR